MVEASPMRATVAALVALLLAPATAGAQQGAATPIVGGGSFNTAPLVRAGSYADTIEPDETVYYKVSLQKGQVLSATATVDTSQIQPDFQASGYDQGLANLKYTIDILSPLRQQLGAPFSDYPDASADLSGSAGAAERGTATGPRVLGYDQILASNYSSDAFPGPGQWYIAVSAYDDQFDPARHLAELPLQLDVKITGTPEPSSPNFASGLPGPAPTSPTATPTPLASTPVSAPSEPGTGDPALTIGLVAVLALVGGLVLGVLAAVVLGVGRRQAAASR
jgi:hypothetical protein